ncbi:hypothetical protein NM208_g2243 [Fusarium decemcellulare]|uniref:Uncharacterized protein n=1 Tax=Fusarium decemcellulare TaxID=57161 RepID=A0ACC1STB0_9HYPO|nr:hypothetical protein NM208_g2243 [Fusarium decemcellulare]
MSFGFSPGDIAMFTKFANTVVNALREEGGSKSEYQIAERQCKGFLAVVREVKALDFSGVPESFQAQMIQYSAELMEHVQDFRETVARYEKSMGETTKRGFFSSAPRKIQWAFSAAEDLDTFRKNLSAQIDLIKLVLQFSIFSLVSNNQAQTLPRERGRALEFRKEKLLGWDSDPMYSVMFHRGVENITELVYERLLRKPALPIQYEAGRVHTLADDGVFNQSVPQIDQAIAGSTNLAILKPPEATSSRAAAPDSSSRRPPVAHAGWETTGRNALTDDLNEYLQAFGLDPLTEREAQYTKSLDRMAIEDSRAVALLPGVSASESSNLSMSPQFGDRQQSGHIWPEPTEANSASEASAGVGGNDSTSGQKGKSSFPFDFNFDPVSSMGIAAQVISMASYAAELSRAARKKYLMFGVSNEEMDHLSSSLSQYSDLLRECYDIICFSTDERLSISGYSVFDDSQHTLHRIRDMIHFMSEWYILKPKALRNYMKAKKVVAANINRIESLKSTLSIVLQLLSIRITDKTVTEKIDILSMTIQQYEARRRQANIEEHR